MILEERNIAVNTEREGYPHPLESDSGWGGGAKPWDIVDGKHTYPGEWARGLAFTGGRKNWAGKPCGPRQATINLGNSKTFYKAIIWHHGQMHIPKECKLQYWDGSKWIDIDSNREVDLEGEHGSWSAPDTHTFKPVTGSKIRYVIDNCGKIYGTEELLEHGWIYEFEVYEAVISEPIANLPIINIEGIGDKFAIRLKQRGIITIRDIAMVDIQKIPYLFRGTRIPLHRLYVAKRRAELALSVKIDPTLRPLSNIMLREIMKIPAQQLSNKTNLPIGVIYTLKRDISTLLCALDNRVVLGMTLDKFLMY
jgi:hypothetical protein